MSDPLAHECGVALLCLRRSASYYREKYGTADFGGTKLSLLLEKQHNRGQDGAGAAMIHVPAVAGQSPYALFKSVAAQPLTDLLRQIAQRNVAEEESLFLGHLRYATFGRGDITACHPFVHVASTLERTLLLAGNFNLTNTTQLFDAYRALGAHPTSHADGYLITELLAHELRHGRPLEDALRAALANADGAYTLVGTTAAGTAFAIRDPHGIRPGYYYVDDEVVVVASERPAIQAAFDCPPEAVHELPAGQALIFERAAAEESSSDASALRSPSSALSFRDCLPAAEPRGCVFERIYFSRANDADIHAERKALGAALAPQIESAAAPATLADIFLSYIPNSAQIAFHGLLQHLLREGAVRGEEPVRFGQVAVKDAKFRTFIADAAARREFYKHVYDVTYGLVRAGSDTLVVLDDSIVRGNTMQNAVLPMLDRLGPRRIVVASSAPPIRYPDCYGIDMSTLGELVAFRALVNLLGPDAHAQLRAALDAALAGTGPRDPLAPLYARFSEEEHEAEIARLLTPASIRAEVRVVFQRIDALHACCPRHTGDWYFTGRYPTDGGYRVLCTALAHYLENNDERSY